MVVSCWSASDVLGLKKLSPSLCTCMYVPKAILQCLLSINSPVIRVLGHIVACTSMSGKLFSQNTMLYTISAISLGGYLLNGNVFVIALTHSFTVLMYHSTLGTCSFLDAMFRAIPISDSPILIHSNVPSANIIHILTPLALYV